MQLTVEKVDDVTVVKLPGDRLDTTNTQDFTGEIAPILEKNCKLVLDASQLEFVDSSGLGAFLFCLKRANAGGGDLKVCGLTKQVRVVFEVVRFHRIIEIYNTVEEAARAFKR